MSKSKLIRLSFFALFSLLFCNNAIACTCWYYEPTFCRELDEDENVLKVVIEELYVSEYPDFDFNDRMRVRVLENIHLETSHDTLLIFGQDGLNCAEYLDDFNLSDTLIIGTKIYNDTTVSYLNGCGLSFLKFQNDTIYGQITDDLTFQHIEDFKDNLFTCIDLETSVKDPNEHEINIYPNPFNNIITIEFSEPILKMELIDLNGKIIQSVVPDNNLKTELTVSENGNSIFFLRIFSEKGILTRKLIKL